VRGGEGGGLLEDEKKKAKGLRDAEPAAVCRQKKKTCIGERERGAA